MLSPPNSALVARDPALPGLGLMLDPAALAATLGTASVSLRHLRYKPGTSCSAAAVTADGRWLRLRALTPARFAEKGHPRDGATGAACLVVAPPEGDRDVPGLRRFWPDGARPRALAGLFGEHHLAQARLVPLSHRVGRRLVARLDHPLGAALLKLHAPERFAQAQAGALWGALHGHGALVRACAKDLAVVTRWQPGRVLTADADPQDLAAAGAALARVHDAPMALPFPRTRTDEIAGLTRTLADAALLVPEAAGRLDSLARRLTAALSATPAEPGPIHGDFSADQVVIAPDGGACLIDWDRAGTGDRGADLGSALARIAADRLWDGLPEARAQAAAQALLDGYARHRALPASVGVQRLAHLALLLCEPFRRQLPDWPGAMGALIDRLDADLNGLSLPGTGDPALPGLATLCDRRGAQALLDGTGAGHLAEPPRLVRHKPGRRALVMLAARTPAGPCLWLAKTRSKRPDHATPALHTALRAAGFDGRPGAAFGVPDVLAGPEGWRTFLMAHVPGRPLSDWLVPGADLAPFHATGRALAAFHAAPVDPGRTWDATDELAVADAALAAAQARNPDAADRIAALRPWARRLAHTIPAGAAVLLHRDFHPDQALVDATGLWLIDLDLAARGDRHIDLGNMLAHLTEYALRRFGDPQALAPQARAFLDGYAAGGGGWSDAPLAAMHDLSLLRHLDICARFADRRALFAPLLELVATPARDPAPPPHRPLPLPLPPPMGQEDGQTPHPGPPRCTTSA
ncbi:MAG: aminoglycoside phosphotransferase family protein [Rhodobacteraceae bacterium]|jgi:aminoglycoside phosphotransferase (APT) family kinase protein|nr:aminoglycoside phosphotransferase family protein [Paracoccaceae bacterium]